MKSIFQSTVGFVFLLIASCVSLQAYAQETIVDTPGAHVYTGSAGTTVNVPGVSVNVPSAQPQAPQPYAAPAPVAAPQAMVMQPAPAAVSSYANANMPGMDFSNQNLAGADFSNAALQGADFTGADLRGAHLSNSTLDGANLTNADLSQADLSNASLNQTIAVNTRFVGTNLANVDMGHLIRQVLVAPVAPPEPRPTYVDAGAISMALKAPQKKIDLTINFDFNSDKLTPDGMKQIDQVARALLDPALQKSRIMIEGHTDNVGSEDYNKDLSYRRAMRVSRLLIDQYGIAPARLSAQGFGKSKPIASNDTDLGRAMNRRVTLVNLGE